MPVFVAANAPDPIRTSPDRLRSSARGAGYGGAIRGAVRGDIFWGFGARAESIAGRMKAPGRLFVLLPRALAARVSKSSP